MSDPIGIRRGIRNTKRAAEVIKVLAKHGFQQFLSDTGIERMIERGQEILLRSKPEAATPAKPFAVRVREALEELGGTFIKLGQVLSTRPDLVPTDLAEELRSLRSNCPTVPYAEIRKRLEEEFGDKLDEYFQSIDEVPLAAASIAQVHRAVLKDGTHVVLKIVRPGIEETIESDIDILTELARLTENRISELGYSPKETVREFQQELTREVDLIYEGRSTDRFRQNFADDPKIHFPIVYWPSTTRRVLTLEHVQGTLLSETDFSSMSPEQRRTICEKGSEAVFRQCLEHGFFHADPHPGNIFATADGGICFIDCGMTGRIDRQTMQSLATLVMSVINSDLDKVLEATMSLCDADKALKFDRTFRRDAWSFMARFERGTIESLDMAGLLNEFFALMRRYRIRCPADLVFLIKAISTIQGAAREIDPTFNLVAHGRPQLEKLIRDRYGFTAARDRLLTSAQRYLSLMEDLPDEVRDVLDQLRRREFSVNLRHHGIDRLNDDTLEHASGTIAVGLVIAGLLVGSSVLILAERGMEGSTILRGVGVTGIVIAIVLAITLPIRWIRRRK
ncbi:MAG: AarF/ABC1/UbiB kinase family protein [Planctomycetota bacterium]|nr:MAG: AarF/ABC1/UbiB kinase family protein [Planctomycetota bacterium]